MGCQLPRIITFCFGVVRRANHAGSTQESELNRSRMVPAPDDATIKKWKSLRSNEIFSISIYIYIINKVGRGVAPVFFRYFAFLAFLQLFSPGMRRGALVFYPGKKSHAGDRMNRQGEPNRRQIRPEMGRGFPTFLESPGWIFGIVWARFLILSDGFWNSFGRDFEFFRL